MSGGSYWLASLDLLDTWLHLVAVMGRLGGRLPAYDCRYEPPGIRLSDRLEGSTSFIDANDWPTILWPRPGFTWDDPI